MNDHRATAEQWDTVSALAVPRWIGLQQVNNGEESVPSAVLELLARVKVLEAAQQEPEPINEDDNDQWFKACMAAIDAATPEQIRAIIPEAAPVATDKELRSAYSGGQWGAHVPALRDVYNLGRKHGAAQPIPAPYSKEENAVEQK